MKLSLVARLPLTLAVFALVCTQLSSSYSLDRLLKRRQSEAEQESTTTTPGPATTSSSNDNQAKPVAQSPRLYPDLPRQPNFIPAFNAPPSAVGNGYQQLIPFGMGPMPNGQQRLNADQQPAPFGRMPASQPRHLTPAERLASQSFADGLGRRLLSLVGINTSSDKAQATVAESRADEPNMNEQPDETTKALQNATVLQQLHKGLNSIYGNLSKMYNSTVQEQLAMLQERFKSETANSTNPWHQRMAERVPMFFKQMAARVGEAQEQLNRAWHEVATANASAPVPPPRGLNQPPPPAVMRARNSIFGQFDPFASAGDYEFMNQFNRQFNFNGEPQQTNVSNAQAMAARVQQLWATQVQPRVSYVRNQIVRAWRDLPGMAPDPMIRAQSNAPQDNKANSSSADLVDSILKEVDIGPTSEYSLVEPKSDGADGGEASEEKPSTTNKDTTGLKLSPEMQARLYQVQRDLNQVWMGLANSLQGAITNVQRTLNPQPQFAGPFDPMVRQGSMMTASGQQQQQEGANPALNEIDDKIKSLSKVQRDADMVNEALLQQQRETQQRQTFGDRFRGFFNNVDMNQLPDRIGEQFNRFGNAVGNFWNQLPNRWDDFVTQVRPQQQDRMRPASSTTTTTTTAAPASERK